MQDRLPDHAQACGLSVTLAPDGEKVIVTAA